MTKTEMIAALSSKVEGLTKKQAQEAVEAVFSCIQESLMKGESVSYPQFGSLNVKTRAPREGRNPITGEKLHIAEKKTVSFKPSGKLKEMINE